MLEQAVRDHGKPASIPTDHGSQFYASEAECRRRGVSRFETEIVRMEILHRLVRVNHLQTNGKIERFYGEIKAKLHLFCGMDDFVDWWNNIRVHMSLDWDDGKTLARAFVRKMPRAGAEICDAQNGERYRVQMSSGGNTGVWVVR